MTPMTEAEWESVRTALVRGGLRECIDNLLEARSQDVSSPPLVWINDENRLLIYRCYDEGSGNTIVLEPETSGYFTVCSNEYEVMTGTEIDGVLYSICSCPGGCVCVLVGEELSGDGDGVVFNTQAEAKAYIRGLTEK